MKKLFIWTKFGCGDCVELKRMLSTAKIPFEALESELYQGWEVAVKETGSRGVPQGEIEYEDGSIERVWDTETLEELFEQIKEKMK